MKSVISKGLTIYNGNLALRGIVRIPSLVNNGFILLFHGLMDSCEFELIYKQAEYYAEAGYTVLTMDFDGHGKSDGALEEMTISKEILDAEVIFKYVKEVFHPDSIVVIGHSQGGIVASAIASNHPKEVKSLVLIAPAGMLGDKIRSGQFFDVSFDLKNLPEKIPVFDAVVGKTYLLDAAQQDWYHYCDLTKNLLICLISGSEDSMVSDKVIDIYEKRYEKGNNTITRIEFKGADHEFRGFEKEISQTIIEFLNTNLD